MHATLLASIPSPSFNVWEIGPLSIHLYGLCIALGVVAAVMISSKRWENRGGDPDDISTIAIWAVPAGVIGARAYHVATDWKTYEGHWIDAFKITQGGLGIPGGILFGVLAGVVVVKVKKLPALDLLDVVAPAIPVAQAIGRLGNWFNQEVFGRPTSLPWGLRIDPEHRPDRYLSSTTFHPTFLYEGLWNLALAGGLVLLERRGKLRRGELFALYVMGYGLGRLWVENLRSDAASLILGVRVNIWMSGVLILGALAVLVIGRLRARPGVLALQPHGGGARFGEDARVDTGAEAVAGTPGGEAGSQEDVGTGGGDEAEDGSSGGDADVGPNRAGEVDERVEADDPSQVDADG